MAAPLLKPPIASTAPRLVAQTSHLLGFNADPNVGIGGSHLVMLGRWPRTVHLLQLTGDGYKELWQKELPSDMKSDDKKFVMGDESFVTSAQSQGEPARCWSAQLRRLHTHTMGGNLKLVTALPPHTLVARNGDALVLYNGDKRVIALKPPVDSPCGQWCNTRHISMCRHPESGWLAVTHYYTHTHYLAVYNSSGELQHHSKLNYEPGRHVALACTASHLVVSEHGTTMLHLHAWSGKEVDRVNLGQVAKLRKGEDKVHSVGVSQGNMLHVAVGKFSFDVTSLYALRIQ